MNNIWTYILIVNILLSFKLWWDYRAKNKFKRIINHKQSAFIDGGLYSLSALFLFEGWWVALGWVVMASGYRWLAFDLLFNWLNGWKWNHEGVSSTLDKFMSKCGVWAEPIKIISIFIGYVITTL